MPNQSKPLTKHNTRYVVVFKILSWLGIGIYGSNIAISFYHKIVSKISCVKWPLEEDVQMSQKKTMFAYKE